MRKQGQRGQFHTVSGGTASLWGQSYLRPLGNGRGTKSGLFVYSMGSIGECRESKRGKDGSSLSKGLWSPQTLVKSWGKEKKKSQLLKQKWKWVKSKPNVLNSVTEQICILAFSLNLISFKSWYWYRMQK